MQATRGRANAKLESLISILSNIYQGGCPEDKTIRINLTENKQYKRNINMNKKLTKLKETMNNNEDRHPSQNELPPIDKGNNIAVDPMYRWNTRKMSESERFAHMFNKSIGLVRKWSEIRVPVHPMPPMQPQGIAFGISYGSVCGYHSFSSFLSVAVLLSSFGSTIGNIKCRSSDIPDQKKTQAIGSQ